MTKFHEKNWKKNGLDKLLKMLGETGLTNERHERPACVQAGRGTFLAKTDSAVVDPATFTCVSNLE